MAAAPSPTSYLVMALGVATGVFGLLRSCGDEMEYKMTAKTALGACEQKCIDAKAILRHECAREIEALNEDWHKRTGK